MIISKYNELFKEYKDFISTNSSYNPKIVKETTNTSPYFPVISCKLSTFFNTDYCTIDMIEKYDEMYLTIDIYTKNKIINEDEVASQLINDELTELTIKFFSSKNLKNTLCTYLPNIDTNITRRTLQYQGMVGSARENIIRR